jgi:hypothetical protein
MNKIIIILMCFLLLNCNFKEKNNNKENNIEVNDIENDTIASPKFLTKWNFYEVVYDGDIVSLQKYIEELDHHSRAHESALSNDDLRILRNTIYAMHGYKFKSKDLQEHFSKFAWYNGTKENVENELSKKELQLIRVIAAMEAANPPSHDDLAGRWDMQINVSVESFGFFNLYLRPDGRMLAPMGEEKEEKDFFGRITIGIRGSWSLDGSTFRIIPDKDVDPFDYYGIVWFGENENLRIIVFEYEGELYKACNFFGGSIFRDWYKADQRPSSYSDYWGNMRFAGE